MLQTNLYGTTFPLGRQSLYKLISTLKESHFCGENFTEKGTTRWQFSPPPSSKEGYLREGLRSPLFRNQTYLFKVLLCYICRFFFVNTNVFKKVFFCFMSCECHYQFCIFTFQVQVSCE